MATDDERRKPLRGVTVADFQWLVRVPGKPSAIGAFIDEADAHRYAAGKNGTVEPLLGTGVSLDDSDDGGASETREKQVET